MVSHSLIVFCCICGAGVLVFIGWAVSHRFVQPPEAKEPAAGDFNQAQYMREALPQVLGQAPEELLEQDLLAADLEQARVAGPPQQALAADLELVPPGEVLGQPRALVLPQQALAEEDLGLDLRAAVPGQALAEGLGRDPLVGPLVQDLVPEGLLLGVYLGPEPVRLCRP
ncbi:hypothetical protein KC355_g18726 [Hortaea werneckii]|nr:hypothetical protein KC355_g18726 [Hortaea werneckii]